MSSTLRKPCSPRLSRNRPLLAVPPRSASTAPTDCMQHNLTYVHAGPFPLCAPYGFVARGGHKPSAWRHGEACRAWGTGDHTWLSSTARMWGSGGGRTNSLPCPLPMPKQACRSNELPAPVLSRGHVCGAWCGARSAPCQDQEHAVRMASPSLPSLVSPFAGGAGQVVRAV